MGRYIQTPEALDKATQIVSMVASARLATKGECQKVIRESMLDTSEAVIVIVNNGPFEAAAYAPDADEWNAFHEPDDHRSRTYVIMAREDANRLAP